MTLEQYLNQITIDQAYDVMDSIDRANRIAIDLRVAGFLASNHNINLVYDVMAKLIESHEGV